MSAKRVLVTGGCGFIPSNLIRHLLTQTPYEVVNVDALTYAGNLDNIADLLGHERLTHVHGDIRDPALVRDVVAGVDVIVNAAAESHVEKSIEDGASEFVTTNVEGTQILLDAIREAPVERFILISSSEVYGTAESAPMDEEHPLNPRSPYAATKAGGDRLAYSYHVTYELPIVILRPFNNYGPFQHPEKVVPRFITQALRDEPLTIHGDRLREPRLALRRRRRRGDRGGRRRRTRPGQRERSSTSRPAPTSGRARSPTSSSRGSGNRHPSRSTSPSGRARSTDTSGRPRRPGGYSAGGATSFESGLERTIAWYARIGRGGNRSRTPSTASASSS